VKAEADRFFKSESTLMKESGGTRKHMTFCGAGSGSINKFENFHILDSVFMFVDGILGLMFDQCW